MIGDRNSQTITQASKPNVTSGQKQVLAFAHQIQQVDWNQNLGLKGAYIPMSVMLAAALTELGKPARVMECRFRATAIGETCWTEVRHDHSDGFLGHTVVHVPTLRTFVDISLRSQTPTPLTHALGGEPWSALIDFDHRNHNPTDTYVIDVPRRGQVEYFDIDPKATAWKDTPLALGCGVLFEAFTVIGKQVGGTG